MELAEPSIEYKDSYIEAAKEFLTETDSDFRTKRYKKISLEELKNHFAEFVERLKSHARGENLPEGYVPASEFWLVEGPAFIGSVEVRHRLTAHLLNIGGHIGYDIRPSMRRKGYGKKILRLALTKARELGIDKILITCDETNEGSRKVIEANGGVFEEKRPNPEGGPDKLRFWIQL